PRVCEGPPAGPEHPPPEPPPPRPRAQPLLELPTPMLAEGGHGGRVESDRAAALGCLRFGDEDLVVDNHARAAGRYASGVQVDVDPTKSGYLPPTHAGGGEQQPGGVQPVGADAVEEGAELLRAPDMHLRCRAPRKVGHSSDVAGDIPL